MFAIISRLKAFRTGNRHDGHTVQPFCESLEGRTLLDALIGSYTINYRFQAAGLAPPSDGNPYFNRTSPGPHFIDAAPGSYYLVNTGNGATAMGGNAWSGDASSGQRIPLGATVGQRWDITHTHGQIVLYAWDWFAGDNDPSVESYFDLYRVDASDIEMQSAQLQPGNIVQFTYETSGSPGPFNVGLFRSSDSVFDASDTLVTTTTVTPNAGGGQEAGIFSLASLPSTSTQPYLLVMADPPTPQSVTGLVIESEEDNNAALIRPASPDVLATYLQLTFPNAKIKIHDHGKRTIEEQAVIMLNTELQKAGKLEDKYLISKKPKIPTFYATAMASYVNAPVTPGGPTRRDVLNGPDSSLKDSTRAAAIDEFSRLIELAQSQGHFVSKHLAGDAIDISIPRTDQDVIRRLIRDFRGVLDDTEHGTGPHWHITYEY